MFLLAMMRASPRLALFTYNHPFKCDAQTLATCALPKGRLLLTYLLRWRYCLITY